MNSLLPSCQCLRPANQMITWGYLCSRQIMRWKLSGHTSFLLAINPISFDHFCQVFLITLLIFLGWRLLAKIESGTAWQNKHTGHTVISWELQCTHNLTMARTLSYHDRLY